MWRRRKKSDAEQPPRQTTARAEELGLSALEFVEERAQWRSKQEKREIAHFIEEMTPFAVLMASRGWQFDFSRTMPDPWMHGFRWIYPSTQRKGIGPNVPAWERPRAETSIGIWAPDEDTVRVFLAGEPSTIGEEERWWASRQAFLAGIDRVEAYRDGDDPSALGLQRRGQNFAAQTRQRYLRRISTLDTETTTSSWPSCSCGWVFQPVAPSG